MNLQQGQQHIKLSDLVGEVEQFELKMTFTDWRIYFNCVIGFDENGLVSDDYLIYDTRTETLCHGIVLKSFTDKNPLFECQLNLIPAHINRLLFKVNIPASKQFSECSVEFYVEGQVISTLRFTNENTDIELGEFYREEGMWYFSTNVEKLSRALTDIVHKKRFLIDLSRKDPEGFLQHQESERRRKEEKQLLAEHTGERGFMVSINTLIRILDIHKNFMNHSGVFIMRESKIFQKIPSKGNRLLVFEFDGSNKIKDFNGQCITLEMKNENGVIENVVTGYDHYAIRYNKQRNSYQFSNLKLPFEIPRLSQSEIDDYYFEMDLHQEVVMQYDLEDGIDFVVANYRVFKLFDRKKPVDILIRDNKIVGLQQDSKLVKTSLFGIFDAAIILRSYNFSCFDTKILAISNQNVKSIFGGYNVRIKVILNYDNEFWLLFECGDSLNKQNIYEHLEVIERSVLL